jgi:aquaporin Z
MKDQNASPFPWRLCFSEFVGTALLVLIGLSLVILMFGTGSPIIRIVPNEGLRRLITGFLFGTTGALIALSLWERKAVGISTRSLRWGSG